MGTWGRTSAEKRGMGGLPTGQNKKGGLRNGSEQKKGGLRNGSEQKRGGFDGAHTYTGCLWQCPPAPLTHIQNVHHHHHPKVTVKPQMFVLYIFGKFRYLLKNCKLLYSQK